VQFHGAIGRGPVTKKGTSNGRTRSNVRAAMSTVTFAIGVVGAGGALTGGSAADAGTALATIQAANAAILKACAVRMRLPRSKNGRRRKIAQCSFESQRALTVW